MSNRITEIAPTVKICPHDHKRQAMEATYIKDAENTVSRVIRLHGTVTRLHEEDNQFRLELADPTGVVDVLISKRDREIAINRLDGHEGRLPEDSPRILNWMCSVVRERLSRVPQIGEFISVRGKLTSVAFFAYDWNPSTPETDLVWMTELNKDNS